MKMINKRLLILAAGFLLVWGNTLAQFRPSAEGIKLERSLQLINNLYVDDVDSKKITEAALRAMLKELDPHSSYLNEEEVRAMNEPLQGNFDGIGIAFNMLTDTLYVMEVVAGGPSQKVGIQSGDKILYVNDTLIAGVKMNNQEVIKKLRGPKGTTVNVKVQRRGVDNLLEFKIVRDKIPIYSIDATYMVNNEIGYIRLSRFGVTSVEEFLKAEDELKAKGMKKLILDLTGNGGGILQTASDIADEFLGNEKLIVYTEGKNQPRFTMNATSRGKFENGDLIILVNEGSASASEIVAGAIQDWDRGIIVGRRTFGKGLVQRQLPLPDGTMIRLTVAKYYTPTGRSIQKPYEEGHIDEYNNDFLNRYEHGEMFDADSIQFPDSLKYTTLTTKRTVYGGGGIMPDYFVPVDTTSGSRLHVEMNAKGIFNRLAIAEVDNNRNALLKSFPDVDAFKADYQITPAMVEKIKLMAAEEKIKWDETEYQRSEKLMLLQLKALIAHNLYDTSAFYKIMNDDNDIFRAGLEILSDPDRYNGLLNGIGSNVNR
ncbi:MAG TPA: peptidase S41 [Porphyromonadaceae bacterium]|jgi:carboxyl-terminal processing protease|nr:peptidase S41 [Porphyromonadaceae bacterium]HBL34201.1 peptidase S41 [Porphyromonadaceae bacterium]HBX21873.1 peptidase S41 [Porphyromonadaceae bacterium]HCM21777.1 peptidase S41 [Porphyromonadaceae bacterium]